MPLDADVAALLEQLRDAPALSDGSVAQARQNYDAAPRPAGADLVRVEDATVAGPDCHVPVRLYRVDPGP